VIRAFLAGAVDYAGLFPPAALAMPEAVRAYRDYLAGADRWALGRFVVPAARLGELAEAATALAGAVEELWRISALVGPDIAGDLATIDGFNREHAPGAGWAAVVDALELRAESEPAVAAIATAVHAAAAKGEVYVEIPSADDPGSLVAALGRHGFRAKIRTGGVTAAQFPPASHVARFIVACARAGVPFKATAGLHHPVRGVYPLTYASDSDGGTMYGFLNLFAAAAAALRGASVDEVRQLLERDDTPTLAIRPDKLSWGATAFEPGEVDAMRDHLAVSFGSCSFEEPLHDLRSLGLL